MSFFTLPDFDDHERVLCVSEPQSGLKAIIALHNTRRGPALGGCRLWQYDTDTAAITDALRLSKGMSYKNALANLPYGGGKAVILGPVSPDKRPAIFKAFAKEVDALNGAYITAEDVGTSPDDMAIVAQKTTHAVGLHQTSGDPSPATAFGTYCGMKSALHYRTGKNSLHGVKIALQGVGHVGYELARLCADEGALLFVSDVHEHNVQRAAQDFQATIVPPQQIYDIDMDIYAPCALGATICEETINRLSATVIAGSANNQLAIPEKDGKRLKDKHILYAPDYAINAGGVINISHEKDVISQEVNGTPLYGYDRQAAFSHIATIADTLTDIFTLADAQNIPTDIAADRLAEKKFKL